MNKPLMLGIWVCWSIGIATNNWIGRNDWHDAIVQMWGGLNFLLTIYFVSWTIKKKKEHEENN